MKIRTSFVSNSSSSSYIVKQDLTEDGIRCAPIVRDRLDALEEFINLCRLDDEDPVKLDRNTDWYVTRFITEYEPYCVYDKLREVGAIDYCDGQTGGVPYDWEDDYPDTICVAHGSDEYDSVYMRREHTSACEYTVEELVDYLRTKYPEATKFVALAGNNSEQITPMYGE